MYRVQPARDQAERIGSLGVTVDDLRPVFVQALPEAGCDRRILGDRVFARRDHPFYDNPFTGERVQPILFGGRPISPHRKDARLKNRPIQLPRGLQRHLFRAANLIANGNASYNKQNADTFHNCLIENCASPRSAGDIAPIVGRCVDAPFPPRPEERLFCQLAPPPAPPPYPRNSLASPGLP